MADTRPIGVYARVSTPDQEPEIQLNKLRRYALDRGVEAREFTDHGVSGARDSRPALDALLVAVRRREVSAVVCTKLDRLARSTRHLCNLAAEFEALGVDLVILDMAADTSTPMGRLLFTVLAGVAEFERSLIVERTRAGMENARRQGKRIGRPRRLDASARRRLGRLRAHGHSMRACATLLGVGISTIHRELSRS
jgi:DNA invertase Pin-like site-specific DNA recombinase